MSGFVCVDLCCSLQVQRENMKAKAKDVGRRMSETTKYVNTSSKLTFGKLSGKGKKAIVAQAFETANRCPTIETKRPSAETKRGGL